MASGVAALESTAWAAPPTVLSEGDAVVADSRAYLLRAAANGREYLVRVAAPQKLPRDGSRPGVIYVLDGNWYFGMAADIARMLPVGTATPPVFVVGIGYADSSFDAVVANRERDYTHVSFHDRPDVGGGGPAFATFLTDELRPFIEQRHGIDGGKTYLAGQSLGGIFTVNMLLKRPESFAGYLIGSPSLWQDDSALPASQTFTKGGGRRVMIGVGAGESPNMRDNAAKLAAALSRPESGLDVATRIFENQNHMSMQGVWLADGLRYLLDAPAAGAAPG